MTGKRAAAEAIPATVVNHDSPVPAFMQVEQDLRRHIISGAIRADTRLPRETELAELYGVSRMTVRRSLDGLEQDGFVRRVHGVGTLVLQPARPVTVELRSMISISEKIRQQGYEPRTTIDLQAVSAPTPSIRAALKLGDSEAALVLRRVRLADMRPVLINTSWLSARRFAGLEAMELTDGSLWSTLSARFGVTPSSTDEYFEMVKASADEARLLQVEEGDTLIQVTGTTYDAQNEPVERCYSLWAGGVRFHFRT
jgi:GntR family transcriptional regulator